MFLRVCTLLCTSYFLYFLLYFIKINSVFFWIPLTYFLYFRWVSFEYPTSSSLKNWKLTVSFITDCGLRFPRCQRVWHQISTWTERNQNEKLWWSIERASRLLFFHTCKRNPRRLWTSDLVYRNSSRIRSVYADVLCSWGVLWCSISLILLLYFYVESMVESCYNHLLMDFTFV